MTFRWRLTFLAALLALHGCIIIQQLPKVEPRAVGRYASPTGSGSACTNSGTPCTVATALSQMQCGDTLTLQNGTYATALGAAVLEITSSTAPSATSCASSPATVQAETEGSVTFDGQNARMAVNVYGMNGWTLLGINAKRGGAAGGSDPVWRVRASSNIIVRRSIAYDATSGQNSQVWLNQDNPGTILYEDVAGFGTAQQVFLDYGNSPSTTWRRIWGRAEGNTQAGGIIADSGNGPATNQFAYGGAPSLIENIIQTYGPDRGTNGFSYITNWLRNNTASPYIRWYGGMHYPRTGLANTRMTLGYFTSAENPNCSGYLLQDQIVHGNGVTSHPSGVSGMRPFYIANATGSGGGGDHCPDTVPGGQQQIMTRVLGIRTGGSSLLGSLGTQTNVLDTTASLASTGWDYTGTSGTPRACFEYQNGSLTSAPLWPWKMDDRIKAAIAANGGTALLGTAGTGYAANTPTSEIVSVFGAIPNACNRAAAGTTPKNPTGLNLSQLWRTLWTQITGMAA
jgi:hypothetical protein